MSVSTLFAYLHVVLADPGSLHFDPLVTENEEDNNQTYRFSNVSDIYYCDDCDISLRASAFTDPNFDNHHSKTFCYTHCYDCGYCIQGRSHHCGWIGKCVGEKT